MNSSCLIGRLASEVTVRQTNSGTSVANFTIAVPRQFKRDETDFFRIVVWGKQGENCAKFTAKGKLIGISGRLQQDTWEDDSGKREKVVIVAENVTFIEWADKNSQQNSDSGYVDAVEDDDDVPF